MMKKIFYLIVFISSTASVFSQIKLGNNINTINISSLIELESTSKGLLFSRMNTAQMNAMTAVNGLTIYNLDSNCLCNYNGTRWVNLCQTTTIPNLILTKTGNSVGLKLGSGNTVYFSVADDDSSKTNEIQTISFANDSIYLSLNGGKVGLKSLIIDTTSLSNRINQRVKYTDTAAMLSKYLRKNDTASLSNRINKKLSASDTASLSNRINQRVKYTDTAAMLSKYLRKNDTASLSNRINKKLNAADTISLSNRINQRVKYTDTAAMLSKYLRKNDTASLSNRINKKLSASDTASLSNRINQRVKYTDTAAMLSKYLRKNDTASLSNRINKNRQAIIDTATSLRNKINTHIVADLDIDTTNEMQTLSITGQTLRISKRNSVTLPSIDTASISNRINQRVKYTDTAAMLSKYLRKNDTASLSNRINKKLSASDTASLSNRINQRVKYADTAAMLSPYLRDGDTTNMLSKYIYGATNGISKSGKNLLLGGALTQATTISTTSTNTLTLSGLQRGASTDSILMVTSSGIVRRITNANLHTGYMRFTDTSNLSNRINQRVRYTDTATMLLPYLRKGNQISGTPGSVFYAGSNRAPSSNNSELFWDTANLRLGIGTNTPTHKLQVNGQVRATSFANADGTAGSPSYRFNSDANTGIYLRAADDIAISTNGTEAVRVDPSGNVGVGGIAPSQKMDVNGRLRVRNIGINNTLDTILVVDANGLIQKRFNTSIKTTDTSAMLAPYIFNGRNGLTKSGKNVLLGGSLIQATTITTSASNTLALAGLQSGNANDSILAADPTTGVIKRISARRITIGLLRTIDTVSLSNRINQRVRFADTATMLAPYIFNGRNGLTKSGKNVLLGGSLIQATTITTSASNTLALAGLQSGNANDSILMITSSGVIKRTSNFPLVNNKTASYTVSVSDHNTVITINSSSATTITIPSGLPVGFNISIYQIGTGRVTIAGASGVTLKNRLTRFRLAGKDAAAGIVITASNVAHVSGDLSK